MNIVEKILDVKILPILRNARKENVFDYAYILKEEGINLMEITLSDEQSFQIIQNIKDKFSEIIIGAGSVLTPEQASRAMEVGAQFIVSPGYMENLVNFAKSENFLIIPGVATPTEVMNAILQGVSLLKIFPAIQLTPTFFKEIKGPFPNIKMIAVGGITTDNVKDFIEAGAHCIGIGSGLFKNQSGHDVTKKEFLRRLRLLKRILKSN